MRIIKISWFLFLSVIAIFSCKTNNEDTSKENFNVDKLIEDV